MPFKSQAQRAYLYSQHPDVAEKFRKEYGPQKGLPERAPAKKKVKHRRKRKVKPKVQYSDPRSDPRNVAVGYGAKPRFGRRFQNLSKKG